MIGKESETGGRKERSEREGERCGADRDTELGGEGEDRVRAKEKERERTHNFNTSVN